ncbi:MAG: hypothetical protein WD708_05650 [Kiritimatiellia bacterium]
MTLLSLSGGFGPAYGDEDSDTTVVFREDFESYTADQAPPETIEEESGWAGGVTTLRVVDSGDAKQGKVLECEVNAFGQVGIRGFEVTPGAAYRVSATVSSRGLQTVTMSLRQKPGPYRTHGKITAQVFESPRRLSFIVEEAQPNNPVRVQFVLRGNTVLTVDDILVERFDGELPKEGKGLEGGMLPDPEWPRGNLAANSSFEVGRDGWFGRGVSEVVPVDDAFDGASVLRIENQGVVWTPFIRLPLRRPTQLVCRVRAIDKGARVKLEFGDYKNFVGGSDGTSEFFNLAPGKEWQRIVLTWTPKTPEGQLQPWKEFYAGIGVVNGRVEVDGVEVMHVNESAEASTDYVPRAPLEFSVDVNMPLHVATVGEVIPVTVLATQPDAACILRCFDEEGRETRTWDLQLVEGKASIEITDMPPGAWRLTTASSPDAAHGSITPPARIEGESMVLVVPVMPEVPQDQWAFGSHIRNKPETLEACWKLGWRWNRMHDSSTYAKWDRLQSKSKDEFALEREKLERLRGPGYHLQGNFDNIPGWLAKELGLTEGKSVRGGYKKLRDQDIELLEAALRKLGEASHGLIEEVEITNEVSLGGITPGRYLEILRAAYRGLKAGNPDITVVGLGGPPAKSKWIFDAIRLGAGKYADKISFHGYGLVTNGQNQGPEPLIKAVREMEEALAEAGTPDVKIQDTESGLIMRSALTKHYAPLGNMTAEDASRALPKSVAAVVASGLDRWYYYAAFEMNHPGEGMAYGTSDVGHVMRMAHQPMAVAISTLAGRDYVGRLPEAEGIVHLAFTGRGGKVHMLWATQDVDVRVPVPEGATSILNMWGRPVEIPTDGLALTGDPVYVLIQD